MIKLSLFTAPIITTAKRIRTVGHASFTKSGTFVKAHKASSLIIGVAVVASVATVSVAAVTSKNEPVAMAPVVKKQHAPKIEKTEEVKSANTTAPVDAPTAQNPTSSTTAATATTTTPATPKAATPQPKKAYDRYANDPSPNALKFIISPQVARLTSPIRVDGPMTYNFDYAVVRDGSYSNPVAAGANCYGSPGKPGDILGSSSNSGVALLTVNYTAPNGTYSCSMSTDIGYTRFQTRFQIEINEEVLTILPGAQVVPGVRF